MSLYDLHRLIGCATERRRTAQAPDQICVCDWLHCGNRAPVTARPELSLFAQRERAPQ